MGNKINVPHGITLGTKHTWRDWRLVPTSRPVFLPPEVKTMEIEIPGSDGVIDLTENLTGEVKYKNRIGSFEFLVVNRERWEDVYSEILNCLHGKRMEAILDDDPNYYYIGRFEVNDWKSEKNNSKITINYNVEPYKLEVSTSMNDWLWDTFDFEHGIIREYNDLIVDGELNFICIGSRKSVVPCFIVEAEDDMKVKFKGKTYVLKNGKNRVVNIVLKEGDNEMTFLGNGKVSIDYRGGSL